MKGYSIFIILGIAILLFSYTQPDEKEEAAYTVQEFIRNLQNFQFNDALLKMKLSQESEDSPSCPMTYSVEKEWIENILKTGEWKKAKDWPDSMQLLTCTPITWTT